eukprot:763365-Hanusia_phi.AAC.2
MTGRGNSSYEKFDARALVCWVTTVKRTGKRITTSNIRPPERSSVHDERESATTLASTQM